MAVVIAALDTTAIARAVLETALRIGELAGAKIEAVHVHDGTAETPRSLAARAGVRLRSLRGRVGPTLAAAMSAPTTIAGVIGARATPGGRQPVGRVAEYVLAHVSTPLVVVPPEVEAPPGFRRVLVPLEGDPASSAPVLEHLRALVGPHPELVVLHVFTPATLPAMLDRPEYDFEIMGKEFLARHLPHASRIVLRPGPIGRRILEVAAEVEADLVVLSWAQDTTGGRARVVREVLGSSPIPVVLLPVRRPDSAGAEPAGQDSPADREVSVEPR
jgi:nucleotide-binding universal stress UspA family protein